MSSASVTGKDLIHELVMINSAVEPDSIIRLCDSNHEWCGGYFTAVIHSLDSAGKAPCVPRRKDISQIQEGLWIIVKSWLYRQPPDIRITINQTVISALTESQCVSNQS